jgi:4-aminobutyrate aminotransferase-like enzyme
MAADTANLSNVWFKVTDLEVASGEGSWVTTTSGDRYLDFSGGIAVTSTGHAHPHVVQAIADQAKRFIHAQANVYTHDLMQPLAARLTELSPDGIDTFFYANSGAEITEAAVKLAKQATGRPNIIVVQGSFHGRTHQAMAMTTSKNVYRAGHAPLPSGIFATPYPNVHAADVDDEIDRSLRALDDMLATMTSPAETAAIIIEPVLGEGGYIAAPARFIEGLDARCKQHGMLFIADEVQSGFGRTGKMFAIEHYDIKPDVICMAKGIASGFPFSDRLARRHLRRQPHRMRRSVGNDRDPHRRRLHGRGQRTRRTVGRRLTRSTATPPGHPTRACTRSDDRCAVRHRRPYLCGGPTLPAAGQADHHDSGRCRNDTEIHAAANRERRRDRPRARRTRQGTRRNRLIAARP